MLLMSSTPTTSLHDVETVLDPSVTVHERLVELERDDLDGFLAYAPLRQLSHTSGPSPDVIKVFFEKPVDVYGVSVSVDVEPRLELVEVSVGRNWENYRGNTLGSLIHTSAVDGIGRGSVIDERAWFDKPFRIDASEWLAVTAWIFNRAASEVEVHPEVTFWFQPASS